MGLRLSLIVVTFNGLRHLPLLRDSVASQSTDFAYEVIVFDNDSSDGTCAWIREHWGEARLFESSRNLLFAAGNNAAAREAKGELLFFLNQDTVLSPGVLAAVAEATNATMSTTLAQRFPWSGTPMVPYLHRSGALLWKVAGPKEREPTNAISGAAFALERSTLDRLGGVPFDARIPHYNEDVNLSLRLRNFGIGIAAISSPYIVHNSTPSKGSGIKDFKRAMAIQRNMLLAHGLANGWTETLRRLPVLCTAGWYKANVDGKGNAVRRLALTAATMLGFLGAPIALARSSRKTAPQAYG